MNTSGRRGGVIIHADDLGYSDAVNHGILDAHTRGIVTSTAFMTNMPGTEAGAAAARAHPDLETGLHVNLTEGRPLTDARTLRGKDGDFRDLNGQLIALTTGRVSRGDIDREVDAQWRRMADLGLPIRHLNGHQHIHLFGGVLDATLALARKHRIAVRRPVEPLWGDLGGSAVYFIRRVLLRWGSQRRAFDGVPHPEAFVELTGPRKGRSADWLKKRIAERSGVIEILCHPGREDAGGNDPLRTRRVEELEILTTPNLKADIEGMGYVFGTHSSFLLDPRP